jgi:hypothetical protein
MKLKRILYLLIICSGFGWGMKLQPVAAQAKDPPPPANPAPTSEAAPPAANPAPPPSDSPKRSAAELEKLLGPIALYPDALIATLLPASVYPLEIVQAARFVADTNNLAKLDAQPWDENVKAVARVPAVIKKMNDDLTWTMALGETFLAQKVYDQAEQVFEKLAEEEKEHLFSTDHPWTVPIPARGDEENSVNGRFLPAIVLFVSTNGWRRTGFGAAIHWWALNYHS